MGCTLSALRVDASVYIATLQKMNIGERIKVARIQRGWTQAALGFRCNLQSMSISHFECGRRDPCAANLRALCLALKCSADFLLDLPQRR